MNLKRIVFACFIILSIFHSNAQIEREIISFVDSTEQIISNGKKLILDEIRNKNFSKAHNIYIFLNQKASEKQCDAFYYGEHLTIALLTSDWKSFTEEAKKFNDERAPICYRTSPVIANDLYEEATRNITRIQEAIQIAEISEEDKELLNLYQYFFHKEKDEKAYKAELKSFKKKYPTSVYNEFVKSYLPKPEVRASMAYSIGASWAFPQGNLKNMFSDAIGFGMDFDFTGNKMYLSLFMNVSSLKLTTPFGAYGENGYNYEFEVSDNFTYFQGGIKGGYYILRSNRFHIAPYLSIGSASLTSDIYKSNEDNYKELKLFNSFYAGVGIHSEIKIYEYKGKTNTPYYYYNYSMPGYISLKFDAGYNFITNQKVEMIKGDMMYASLSLVWGIGKF